MFIEYVSFNTTDVRMARAIYERDKLAFDDSDFIAPFDPPFRVQSLNISYLLLPLLKKSYCTTLQRANRFFSNAYYWSFCW